MLDLAIIGGGPAAISAALYGARAGLKTEVFERGEIGGDLSKIAHLANYPGFVGEGRVLAAQLRDQAEQAGAEVRYGECSELKPSADGIELVIDGKIVKARAVIITTGSEPKTLDFASDLRPPVSYCALCDSDFVKDENIVIVGGGNSAVQEALLLAPLAKSLTLVSHSSLKADHCLQEKLRAFKNCEIREGVEPTPGLLNDFDRIFVFIGRRPATRFLESLQKDGLLDEAGYLLTDENHMTVLPGVFAAGDVRSGSIHQVITAAGDGAAAAIDVNKWFKH